MEAIVIKSEPQEFEYIKQQTLKDDIIAVAEPAQSMVLKSRCGEIFVTKNARNWTFTCTYCEKTTRDIGEFICHIQFKHLNGQYTEDDGGNGDNADESHSQEAAYKQNDFNNQEQNIVLQTQNQTNYATQTMPSCTPTIEQVLSLSKKNTPTLETNSIFGSSISTNAGEELIDLNAATSPHNSNKRKRRLDHEEDSFSVESVNFLIKEEENYQIPVEGENAESIGDDSLESNTLLRRMDERKVAEPTTSEKHVQQQRKQKIKQTKTSPIKCKFCTKEYKTTQAMSNHIRTHTKSNEYQCTMCSLCHSTENQFITHVLTHESDTCFPCMVCGKDLKSNEERDNHLSTHIEERPYGCDFCKRRFHRNSFLTNHLRIHCQYRCDYCSNDFRSMLTQRRPFVCPHCEKVPDFRQKIDSQRDIKLKNNIIETDAE